MDPAPAEEYENNAELGLYLLPGSEDLCVGACFMGACEGGP